MDWSNYYQVCAYARKLVEQSGVAMVVVKHADRAGFNICHKARVDLISRPGVEVKRVIEA